MKAVLAWIVYSGIVLVTPLIWITIQKQTRRKR